MPAKFLLIVGCLCLLAAASWWWAQSRPPPSVAGSTAGGDTYDYYIRSLRVTMMDAEGRPARLLHSDELRHYPDGGRTELVRPRLTVTRDDAPPWLISAESGHSNADGSLVELTGDVRVEREGAAGDRPLLLVTERLRIRPQEDYAETDERVRVTSLESRLDAVGMQAWLRPPGRIKLLSEVKGHYVE